MIRFLSALAIFLVLQTAAHGATRMVGESVVLSKFEPSKLLYATVRPDSVIVRSTYLPGDRKTVVYEAGRDYVIDSAAGTIARTANSRIPDFSTNILYGKRDFDHSKFPGYGNLPFTVYVDYESDAPAAPLIESIPAADQLKQTAAKLRGEEPLKIIAYGDSITAGGDASTVELQYPSRYAAFLREQYPGSRITLENMATGGDNTEQGLARLEEKVLSRKPDLVLVAFGMNDHNLPDVGGVAPEKFRENLQQIVTRIRDKTRAEVILLSTFPPNPDWHFGSHQMDRYAAATKRAAGELNAAYADVHAVWAKVLARKDATSLLGNHINHPNDFGHWLYLEALKALKW